MISDSHALGSSISSCFYMARGRRRGRAPMSAYSSSSISSVKSAAENRGLSSASARTSLWHLGRHTRGAAVSSCARLPRPQRSHLGPNLGGLVVIRGATTTAGRRRRDFAEA